NLPLGNPGQDYFPISVKNGAAPILVLRGCRPAWPGPAPGATYANLIGRRRWIPNPTRSCRSFVLGQTAALAIRRPAGWVSQTQAGKLPRCLNSLGSSRGINCHWRPNRKVNTGEYYDEPRSLWNAVDVSSGLV